MKAWINIFLFVISVHLAWDASTSESVTGYRLYYGNASRSYGTVVDVGNVTDYVLTGVHEEQPMFFAVKAYSADQESDYSVELEAAAITQSIKGSGTVSSTVTGWSGSTTNRVFAMDKNRGETLTVTAAPDDSAHSITALQIDGLWVAASDVAEFYNVSASHSIYFVVQKKKTLTGMEWIK